MALVVETDGDVVLDCPYTAEDRDEVLGLVWAGQVTGLVHKTTNIYLDGEVIVENGSFKVDVPESVKSEAEDVVNFAKSIGFLE